MEFLKLTTNRTITKNEISISGDTLTISITDTTNSQSIADINFSGTFSLSNIVSKYGQDHGCIAFYPESLWKSDTPIQMVETTQLSFPNIVNPNETYTSVPTTEGKQLSGSPFSVISNNYGSYAFLYILTPSANCTIDEITIVYRDSPNASVTVNGSTPSALSITSMKNYLDAWLPVSLAGESSLTAGQSTTYTVNAPKNTTVFLSADNGVLNRSRAINGQTFQLNTQGLNAGEVVTIKMGYKYWAGVSTKTVTLV